MNLEKDMENSATRDLSVEVGNGELDITIFKGGLNVIGSEAWVSDLEVLEIDVLVMEIGNADSSNFADKVVDESILHRINSILGEGKGNGGVVLSLSKCEEQ